MTESLLQVENLSVSFATETHGRITVVEDISFALTSGQSIGLVGESGCGKSVTAMTIMRLLPSPPSRIDNGKILFDDTDLRTLDGKAMRTLRGDRIGMIFQEPMTSLNPVFTIGFQLCEVLRIHRQRSKRAAITDVINMLERVGVSAAAQRLDQYPHELSGGLRQRVMIAMALICRPQLLIADEPTTALDVTIQAQILHLIKELQAEMGMSLLMITHDLGVVAEMCEQVIVMYAGRIVERAATRTLFGQPRHPYTAQLLKSIPRLGQKRTLLSTIPGIVPSPENRTSGCYFAARCPQAEARCRSEAPRPEALAAGHEVACWNPMSRP